MLAQIVAALLVVSPGELAAPTLTPPTPAASPSSVAPRADAPAPATDASQGAGVRARGTLGTSVEIPSLRLGYAVNIRVYEPPSAGTCESLPVLYVTDGSDYWKPELGNIVETLDELISSGRIAPLIAVFIDAWDPVLQRNRRYEQFLPAGTETVEPFESCPFCDFIVHEVVPLVEERYPVDAERRGILGSSLGGFNAAYMALTHPDLFRVVGIQSPSIWRQPWFTERVARATGLPQKVAIDVGTEESMFLPGARALRDAYASRGVAMQYREAPADHSWRHWRATAAEVLLFLYPVR